MSMTDFQRGPARLRWLLIAIVALAALPVFALYLARLNASSQHALEQAREFAASLAQSAASQQHNLVLNARGLAEAIKHIPSIASRPDCDGLLSNINAKASWASSIFLLDKSGVGLCGSRLPARGMNFADRTYFKETLRTGEFTVSAAIIGRVTKQPVVAMAMPIWNAAGEIANVVVIGVEMNWLPAVANAAQQRYQGLVLVMNRDGGLVSRHVRNSGVTSVTETGTSDATLQRLVTAAVPVLEFHDEGIDRIYGIAHVKDMQLTVAVSLDRNIVVGPIQQRFWIDLAWLLLVAAGSIGLALTVAEFSVLRGVRTLNATALRLKAGRMGTRVNLSPRVASELHDLAASFNSMIAEFERLAYLDRLTGLPNRRYLERQMLTRGTERDKRGNLIPEALLAIDLDGFKPVNDVFGHAMGDKVLAAVARRIAAVASDRAMVARLGGDEFVALIALPGAADPRASARAFGDEIRNALREPVDIDGNLFPVGASIGVAVVPEDAETLAGALVIADAALYEAKRTGRNRVIDQAPSLVSDGTSDHPDLLEGHWTGLDLIGYDRNNY
ncbi:MAG: diguanylate cyclase [Xanthobacteraceae bacterium]|jgi:diguanylate cyclase (GGDEF)-like protein